MTTAVTVTVASHKVIVTEHHVTEGEEGHFINEQESILEYQGQSRTFYIHSTNSLFVQELAEASMPDPINQLAPEKIGEEDQD